MKVHTKWIIQERETPTTLANAHTCLKYHFKWWSGCCLLCECSCVYVYFFVLFHFYFPLWFCLCLAKEIMWIFNIRLRCGYFIWILASKQNEKNAQRIIHVHLYIYRIIIMQELQTQIVEKKIQYNIWLLLLCSLLSLLQIITYDYYDVVAFVCLSSSLALNAIVRTACVCMQRWGWLSVHIVPACNAIHDQQQY